MGAILRFLKIISIFTALLIVCYFLCVVAVLLVMYFFFNDITPSLEIVFLVFGVLLPAVSIFLAITGTTALIKRTKKDIYLKKRKVDNE